MKNNKKFACLGIILLSFFITAGLSYSQWVQTGLINGGTVNCVASNGNRIFAGSSGSGVFASTNNGDNWTPVNNGLVSTYITCLIFSGENLFAGGEGSGVSLTTNYGTSWVQVNTGLTNLAMMSFAVSGSRLYAGNNYGVFVTTNNGGLWTRLNNGLPTIQVVSLAASGEKVYAGTTVGVYFSSNNGENWVLTSGGMPYSILINALAVSGNCVLAGANGEGIFITTNNGTNWAAANNGLTNKTILGLLAYNSYIFASGTRSIFLSTDYGGSWLNKSQGVYPVQGFYGFTTSGSYIYAGAQYGYVWRRLISEAVKIQNISTLNPGMYSLSQNYPNPFNGSTKIRFSVSKSGKVFLEIFDIRGRKVHTEINSEFLPGTYEFTFNAYNDITEMPSGVYLYRLSIDNFTESRKMMLVK